MQRTPSTNVSSVSDCNRPEGYKDTAEGVAAAPGPPVPAETPFRWKRGDRARYRRLIYDVLDVSDNGLYLGSVYKGHAVVKHYVQRKDVEIV